MQIPSPLFAAGRAGEHDPVHRVAVPVPAQADDGTDAPTVFDRVRVELVALHATVIVLQRCLGPTLAAAAGDGAVLRAGQALDLIAQSLDGLAAFVGAAGRPLASGRVDAAAAAAHVKLDQLSSRLAGRAPAGPDEAECGDLELF